MKYNKRETMATVKSFGIALLIALMFRSLLFDPFNIPSGSMKPTLLIGDYVFVNKFSYGYSRFSFPFGLAPFSGRIFKSEPKRGDIVVFRLPQNHNIFYIKRLIGLPGDEVRFKSGQVFINGQAVKREEMGFFKDPDTGNIMTQYQETMDNGVSYKVLDDIPFHELDNTPKFVVPEKHYFFSGDNRDHSGDSRITAEQGGIGFVHEKYLLGRASMVFFSSKAKLWEFWAWLSKMDFKRFFIIL